MVQILGLDELTAHLGGYARLTYRPSHDFKTEETITGATSSATAIVKQVNSEKRELVIEPTSSEYFQVGESISGSDSGGTGISILPSEITALKLYYEASAEFIKNYTSKVYTGPVTISLISTTREGDRYYRIKQGPLNSISSLKLGGVIQTEDEDFWVNYKTGRIDFGSRLEAPEHPNNLEITANVGTNTIPENVKLASALFCTHIWELRNRNITTKGADSFSFGGRSINFSRPVAETEIQAMLPELKSLLGQVAKIRVG